MDEERPEVPELLLNVAVTDVSAVSVTLQSPAPLHPLDHPAKVDPALGVALNVTAVPLAKLALHVWPQLMPAGLLVIVPPPVPALCTLS